VKALLPELPSPARAELIGALLQPSSGGITAPIQELVPLPEQTSEHSSARLGGGSRLVAAGILIGLGASYWLTRFLASQVSQVSPTDPLTFAGAAIAILCAGIAACFVPARRAASVDPQFALRWE
jgi:hypothetical protein